MARILIGNIKGPKGDTGIQGPQGPIGPAGPQGPLPELINNASITEAGVAALDAAMGKNFQDQLDEVNNNLSKKADASDIEVVDYATFTNETGWSTNMNTDVFQKYCKKIGNIIYLSVPIRSYTSVNALTSINVAKLSVAPLYIQSMIGRHTNENGNVKGIVFGFINRAGVIMLSSTSDIVSGDFLYVKSIPGPWF